MKTTAAVLLVLPTVFFLMMFVYGPLDQDAYLLFGILSLLSAVACLGWAWFLRHGSRKLAWACVAVGSLYVVLLVVVPVLVTLLAPHPTRTSTGAEPGASPNSGPSTPLGNSGAAGGPPSVS
jgi:ABC-type sugar transport system permease subunit